MTAIRAAPIRPARRRPGSRRARRRAVVDLRPPDRRARADGRAVPVDGPRLAEAAGRVPASTRRRSCPKQPTTDNYSGCSTSSTSRGSSSTPRSWRSS